MFVINITKMKKNLFTLLLLSLQLNIYAQGWPENYDGVMLQGFYWDSYEDAKWTTLTAQANELSSYFSLIWVPNSGQTKEDQWNSPGNWGYENMGYMPVYWLKHNTCFGTQEELVNMINTFKSRGTGFIEDVVINHKNGLTNWADFPDETVTGPVTGKTYTITWANDMSNLWGICKDDEVFTSNNGVHDGVTYHCGNANKDEADNFDGCRDLDHTNSTVQQNIYEYLDFLLDELGYVGFRYDMVKGYKPYYTGLYNEHAEPQFSVGEYWDGSYSNVADYWIKGTSRNGSIQSAAFDFPLKDKINAAFNSGSWNQLSNKGIAGDPNMSRYSVTFVDNHDTYREYGYRVNNNVLAANAFILSMPGTPCIFLPHWKEYKPELKKMIAARKAAGITNQSKIIDQYELENGYYLKVQGTEGSILLTLGNLLNQEVNTSGYTLVQSGNNFAMYLSSEQYNEDTYNAIEAESARSITVYVMDHDEGAPYLYEWNGGSQINGGWPGALMDENNKVSFADGTTWYKQTFSASSINVIVTFNNGNQSPNIENVKDDIYISYYKNDNKKYADYTSLYKSGAPSEYSVAYFDAPAGWNKVWAWSNKYFDVENKNYTGGDWPGHTMTKVGTSSTGNDIYQWKITNNISEGVPNMILFNNHINNDSGGQQTGDFEFVNGAYYDRNGLNSEEMLYFYPSVLQNASLTTGKNWNGNNETLAQGNASTTMKHAIYYPAGTYTVQAIVRGTDGCTAELKVGEGTSTTSLTGLSQNSASSVSTDGLVEHLVAGENNGWQKLQAKCTMTTEGTLTISLSSNASEWQVGAITILKDADSQDKYRTIATTSQDQTYADVTRVEKFSFYERGVNKNALVMASSGQVPASLPCNVVVGSNCSNLILTDGAYDFYAPIPFTADAISYNRSFDSTKKVTVCLPFAISSEELENLGITAYKFDAVRSNGSIHFTVAESMEANTPYVVSAEGTPFASLSSRTVSKTENLSTTINDVEFIGTMSRAILNSDEATSYYGYSNGQFVKVGRNVGINPFRAYIKSGINLGASADVVFDNISDDIRDISKTNNNNSTVYGIDGRLIGTSVNVNKLPKGIYIVNGKKIVIR